MGRYVNKRYKTKRRTKDLDTIFGDDMKSDKSIDNLTNQKINEERPGLGQFYCIPCGRYFETEVAKRTHVRGKIHKRRLKELKEGAYTKEEADAAAGHNVAKYQAAKQAMEQKQEEPAVKQLLTAEKKIDITKNKALKNDENSNDQMELE